MGLSPHEFHHHYCSQGDSSTLRPVFHSRPETAFQHEMQASQLVLLTLSEASVHCVSLIQISPKAFKMRLFFFICLFLLKSQIIQGQGERVKERERERDRMILSTG